MKRGDFMYIGIDIGGMSIKAGIVDGSGKLLCKYSVPTPSDGNDAFCAALGEAVDGALRNWGGNDKIEAIGIGAPGMVDRENCVLVHGCNIKYENVPVGTYLKNRYNAPVLAENDANCAAVGEYYAAQNVQDFVFITLGTGVGGGVIINGKLFTGANGAGTELGHIVTHAGGRKCGCGRLGCWEAYASTSGLITLTKENREKIKSISPDEEITGKTAFDKARGGDGAAKAVCDEWINEIAIGLTDVVNIFQPDEVVIGGAVSKEGDTIMKPLRDYVYKNEYTASNAGIKKTKILVSRLGGDAGIIGAALLWKNKNE